MSVVSIGLALAKTVFQVHGVDASGQVKLRKRPSRHELVTFFAKLPPCLVGMEACSSAHHWARELVRLSKGGDRYLRTLLIQGARALVDTSFRKDVTPRPWLKALLGRRPVNVAATAVAHKTARALWAMLTRAETYRRPAVVAAAGSRPWRWCSLPVARKPVRAPSPALERMDFLAGWSSAIAG